MACSLAPGSRTDQRAGQPSPHRSPPRAGLWRCRGEGTPPWPGPGTVGLVSLGIQEAPVGRTAWEGELCPRGDRCSQGALGSSARRLLGRGSVGPHDSGETLPLPLVGTLHGRQGQPVLWRGLRWGVRPLVVLLLGTTRPGCAWLLPDVTRLPCSGLGASRHETLMAPRSAALPAGRRGSVSTPVARSVSHST